VGLFGVLGAGSRVQDLEIIAMAVTGEKHVGGLAGTNQGQISDVRVSGTINGQGATIGGLVGSLTVAEGALTPGISNSHTNVDIVATEGEVGGLVGYVSSGSSIEHSSSQGTVTGRGATGGLVGK